MTSPIFIDYLLAKLSIYSSTPNRDKFKYSKNLILSSFDLLTNNQNLYIIFMLV